MSLTCCDCGQAIQRPGKRGPLPKRCRECRKHNEKSRLANRNRYCPGNGPHAHECKQCGEAFHSARRRQTYCSPRCAQIGKRKRVHVTCARAACGRQFQTLPSRLAKGHRFCCRDCSYSEPRVCHNPTCGRHFRMKYATKNEWQNKGKYCCRECAWDHRWGADRPRKSWSKSHLASASAGALQTSLRKKCKLLGVPNDSECTRRAVLERDGWICQRCLIACNREYIIEQKTRRPDPRNAEHDHIIPLTEANSPGNVFPNSQCLCRKCNNTKRARSWGQLRLDLEGSVKRWESAGRGQRQRSLSSCEEIPAAVL